MMESGASADELRARCPPIAPVTGANEIPLRARELSAAQIRQPLLSEARTYRFKTYSGVGDGIGEVPSSTGDVFGEVASSAGGGLVELAAGAGNTAPPDIPAECH